MSQIDKYTYETATLPKYNSLDTKFNEALQVVDDIVLKNYITKLKDLNVIPLSNKELEENISENVRFFKINEMVYEKDEYSTHKFASVFNTLATNNCAVFIIIDSNGQKTDFYMGVRSLDSERTSNSLKNTLKNALSGQFPGIKTQDYFEDEMYDVLKKVKASSIASVSGVANNRLDKNTNNKSFIQGLEKLALSLQGERYTGVIIANASNNEQLSETRKNYEKIYTQLAPFSKYQISYANNSSINQSKAFTQGSSSGTSYTRNQSSTSGTSEGKSQSISNSTNKESSDGKIIKGLASVATMLSSTLGPVSLEAGVIISSGLSLLGQAISSSETHGVTDGTSFGKNESNTNGESFGENKSTNRGTTDTKGLTTGTSETISLTAQDKSIINTLERIDTQLKRLKEFESLGMWECAAYFLADNSYGAEIAASTYRSLMRGENSGVEVSAVNSWSKVDGDKPERIKDYVTRFMHPIFSYNSLAGHLQLTPSTLVSGNELALHMGLPRKSVSGFPVIEHADFGKEVVSYSGTKSTYNIKLGNVFNMGSECTNRVNLDRNSLAMHTFITGSTGSGKSNTVYELLDKLDSVGINFLIIEPAKGEYKNMFGNRRDVHVFGSNPIYSDILKINPFKFPQGVHVLEHIDRLVEIFNVCWPMYAAMPAVLKDAILQSYEVCGWNLIESKNEYSQELFPTFKDLQNELVNVIENSGYSQELKSNYIGALVTRVKSLTNGLNGQIFCSDEVDNEILFDKNVIVDLSRIGSSETKSLIMGILVMRLNEHRMSFANGMNVPLKHVTVLEEAHNILKRTSNENGSEGANVAGKSVEMLSNAIAEMRTYGEGFIIADQSPSAVDVSAIRNTNTKIIMRLPDETDRRLAGKAAALKDEQLDEIAKLPKGVAVVYQNDWIEPVLCKIDKYDGEETYYKYDKEIKYESDNKKIFISELLKLLLKCRNIEQTDINIDILNNLLGKVDVSSKHKMITHFLLKEYLDKGKLTLWENENFDKLSELVTELFDCKVLVNNTIQSVENFEVLTNELCKIISKATLRLEKDIILAICHCIMKDYSKNNSSSYEIYAAWISIRNKMIKEESL